MIHHLTCHANYPEKLPDEPPQMLQVKTLDDSYTVSTCVDCGAFETNLPEADDPYWDEAKKELGLVD